MKILYHMPSLETVYAARFIYEGYGNAFLSLGHEFCPYTASDDLKSLLESFEPDIFITSLNSYNLKFLDLELLKKHRKKGMVMFTQLNSWKRQCSQLGSGLEDYPEHVKLITDGLAGDIFYNWLQQDDPFMHGFTKTTGYPFHTILLAADKTRFWYEYDLKYECDVAFVGSYLPDKRAFIKQHLLPAMRKYNVKVYGSDWTLKSRVLGYTQKVGQYFNIPGLKNVRRIQLPVDDERKLYSSASISLNMHEAHQRKHGSDFNERTFKIIACGGFEICDNVKVLRRYFKEDEFVIGEDTQDYLDKIDFYLKNPEKRQPIIEAGMKKVLSKHTYHNRVDQMLAIYERFN